RAWLEAKKLFTPQKYKPWLDEILTDLPGGVFNYAENPVRTAPDDAAETIALTDTCTTIEFDYKSVQREWMQIYLPANQVTGWIRWRKGQRIQIMFMLLT
ncbi:MAG: hypothetical protein EAZ89_03730, partial [Bacteroidetes bacterium]